MQCAVLGTGTVGRTLAARLVELGHEVRLGTRDPSTTRSRDDWTELAGVELTTFEMGHFNAYPLAIDKGSTRGGEFRWANQPPQALFDTMRRLGVDPLQRPGRAGPGAEGRVALGDQGRHGRRPHPIDGPGLERAAELGGVRG